MNNTNGVAAQLARELSSQELRTFSRALQQARTLMKNIHAKQQELQYRFGIMESALAGSPPPTPPTQALVWEREREWRSNDIGCLGLSVFSENCLRNVGIVTVGKPPGHYLVKSL
jgi:hypothetical protein